MTNVRVRFPPGHFYSPIVDPFQVEGYIDSTIRIKLSKPIPGIVIDKARMVAFWQRYVDPTANIPFEKSDNDKTRYHLKNHSYGPGDALVLRAFVNAYRPKKIIEIGSGFSTACLLDAAEVAGLNEFQVMCIEPYPDVLKKLLRANDSAFVTILQEPVQNVQIEIFEALEDNDILLIDSTHVLKSGSDVHYELFHILPALKSGVLIHIHDIQYPFEYPKGWILEDNFSWNEIYAVQAFLMYNEKFEIEFFTNYFGQVGSDVVSKNFPELAKFPQNLGGSLWLRKK